MSSAYVYRKPVHRPRYRELRRYLVLLLIIVAPIAGVGYFVYSETHTKSAKPVSGVTTTVVSSNKESFNGPHFQFQDYGKWVLDKKDSTTTHTIYDKYQGQELQGTLNVYTNNVPADLSLSADRVLPVRIVNGNSFQVTGVSDPCANQYAPGEVKRVKEMTINNATFLCDPVTSNYTVILSEIGGDYRLHLKTASDQPVQLVITYRNVMLDPTSDSIITIAQSFMTE